MILIIISSSTAGGSRRPLNGKDGRRLPANRMVKPALRRHIMYQRCARRYLMEFDKVFYCTRSEGNISYFYYAARKYSYLFILGPLINTLINLQFKVDRLITDSFSITKNVII
jgi:hypothetical protein